MPWAKNRGYTCVWAGIEGKFGDMQETLRYSHGIRRERVGIITNINDEDVKKFENR